MAIVDNENVSPELSQCLDLLPKLNGAERDVLLDSLLSGSNDFASNPIEQAWVKESLRRLALLDAGKMTARPADDVIRDLRARYK